VGFSDEACFRQLVVQSTAKLVSAFQCVDTV
jgi:hypothetical protein